MSEREAAEIALNCPPPSPVTLCHTAQAARGDTTRGSARAATAGRHEKRRHVVPAMMRPGHRIQRKGKDIGQLHRLVWPADGRDTSPGCHGHNPIIGGYTLSC